MPLLEWHAPTTTFVDAEGDNELGQVFGVNERDAEEFISIYVLRRPQWFNQGVLGEGIQRGAQADKPQQGAADLALSRLSQPTVELFIELKLDGALTAAIDRQGALVAGIDPHVRLARDLPPDWKTANLDKQRLFELTKEDLLRSPAEMSISSPQSAPSRLRKPSPNLIASRESAVLYEKSEALEGIHARLSDLKISEASSRSQPDPSQWLKWGWYSAGQGLRK